MRNDAKGCPAEIRAALTGPVPSVCTPFTRDGEIDFASVRTFLDFVIDAGAKAVVLTHGDSLYSILTDAEVAEVTKAVVEHVDHRALVVAAERIWWMGKAVEFGKYCAEVGADLYMVLPPDWAGSTTVESLVEHYRAISEHIPVMVVTNYLGTRGMDFGLRVIGELYERVPGIVAVKDDVCGAFARKLGVMTHERWAVLSGGQKQNHLDMVPYGEDSYLSTFFTFRPEIAWRYWRAIECGDTEAAGAVVRDYDMPLFDYLVKVEGSFDAAAHGILELRGLAKRYRRPPYHTLTDAQMDDLRNFLLGKNLL